MNNRFTPKAEGERMLAGIKVLVVDDEPDALATTECMLDFYEATVVAVNDPLTGLEQVQTELPDVIVSDIGMPRMDGYKFIREVRNLPPHKGGLTPAVALTAFNFPEDRKRAIEAGFQKHLSKPVQMQTLVEAIASMAGKKQSS
jgi:CheY-like chemotaxis protein